MESDDPLDFVTEFEDQEVAKTYIERANDRLKPDNDSGEASEAGIIRHKQNNPFPLCSCENPTLTMSPYYNNSHSMCAQSTSYLPVSPVLCCACRMMQSLPICSCAKSVQHRDESQPSESSRKEHDGKSGTSPVLR